MATCLLRGRCLIKISGADAGNFLQNLITQDVSGLEEGRLVYACLLTAQGRFLHDLFIFRAGGDFFLECERERREDLLRRLGVFRLRAKVVIEDCAHLFDVYYSPDVPEKVLSFPDPRLKALGFRFYLPKDRPQAGTVAETAYRDMRIALGVPEGTPDIKPEMDTLASVNLDRLNAVSWQKGCFVGQEVAARMENRGLVKKRMMIVSGAQLAEGSVLTQGGYEVGEVRSVDSSRVTGLAVLKIDVLGKDLESVLQADGAIISVNLPDWLDLNNP